eukprot:scaffold13833_cov108-Phaeocystis_antarctica.AAC.3
MKRGGGEVAPAHLERARPPQQWQMSSAVAGERSSTVLCHKQLQARYAVLLGGLAAAPTGRGLRCNASLCQFSGCCKLPQTCAQMGADGC